MEVSFIALILFLCAAIANAFANIGLAHDNVRAQLVACEGTAARGYENSSVSFWRWGLSLQGPSP